MSSQRKKISAVKKKSGNSQSKKMIATMQFLQTGCVLEDVKLQFFIDFGRKMLDMEQATIDGFNKSMSAYAQSMAQPYDYFSLAGQDRDAADYLLSTQNQFALVEFKFTEKTLDAESKKWRRLKLCQALQQESAARMVSLHDKCHFICWVNQIDLNTLETQLNIYRHEVCNCQMWRGTADHGMTTKLPKVSTRLRGEAFAGNFFTKPPKLSLGFLEFKEYIDWLLKIPGGKNGQVSLQVIVKDPRNHWTYKHFSSLDALHAWINTPPSPSSGPTSPNLQATNDSGPDSSIEPAEDDDPSIGDTPSMRNHNRKFKR
jgi:hypothetical protein